MSVLAKESYLKYKVCVVCNTPQSQAPGVIYAKFPTNVNRCRKWIRVIGNVSLLQLSMKKIQYRFVCGDHFEDSCFTKSGKHLTKDAVPTIFPFERKPLTKDVVKLFPPLISRSNKKVLLECTQRIVKIKKKPDNEIMLNGIKCEPTDAMYQDMVLDEAVMDPKTNVTARYMDLDSSLNECLPKIIPILHHNLPPNSQTTEIYTIDKDKQVIPITTKVMKDGKECIIELSQKKQPPMPKEKPPKVIPISNEALSSILRKSRNVEIVPLGYAQKSEASNLQLIKELQSNEESLQRKIKGLQRRNRQLKRMLKNTSIIEEIESPNLRRIIEKAIRNQQLNVGFNEFTQERQMAIAILKRALKAYHYLSCLIPLPKVCALQKIITGTPVTNVTTKCVHNL